MAEEEGRWGWRRGRHGGGSEQAKHPLASGLGLHVLHPLDRRAAAEQLLLRPVERAPATVHGPRVARAAVLHHAHGPAHLVLHALLARHPQQEAPALLAVPHNAGHDDGHRGHAFRAHQAVPALLHRWLLGGHRVVPIRVPVRAADRHLVHLEDPGGLLRGAPVRLGGRVHPTVDRGHDVSRGSKRGLGCAAWGGCTLRRSRGGKPCARAK
mmetsp:Transcript_8694/g.26190  ORF Transcript_8694/g.26190 Transcript_8694/m.26190 type:complete len:211 (-) Transcript_8694:825-1457(-)